MPRGAGRSRTRPRTEGGLAFHSSFLEPHTWGHACAAPLFAELLAVSAGEGSLQPRCPRKAGCLHRAPVPLPPHSPALERTSEEASPLPPGGATQHRPPSGPFTGAGQGQLSSQPPQASWSLGQNWTPMCWALLLGSFSQHMPETNQFPVTIKSSCEWSEGSSSSSEPETSELKCGLSPHWTRYGVFLEGQMSSFKGC